MTYCFLRTQHGRVSYGLEHERDETEMTDLTCPACGYAGALDVYSAKSCDDPHAWIHCPDCDHIWQPDPPKEKSK